MRSGILWLCALAGAMSLTPPLHAADGPLLLPILLYDFGDKVEEFGPAVTAAHTSATAADRRDGELGWYDLGSYPPLSQGVAYLGRDSQDAASTDALTFDLVIDPGWEAAMTGWSLAIAGQSDSTERFEMTIQRIGPGGSAEHVADWGWFVFNRKNPATTDMLMAGEGIPAPITLTGGHRYRFSLEYADYNRSIYLDNVALHGQVRAAPQVPEPASAALLAAAAMVGVMVGPRGRRGAEIRN